MPMAATPLPRPQLTDQQDCYRASPPRMGTKHVPVAAALRPPAVLLHPAERFAPVSTRDLQDHGHLLRGAAAQGGQVRQVGLQQACVGSGLQSRHMIGAERDVAGNRVLGCSLMHAAVRGRWLQLRNAAGPPYRPARPQQKPAWS